jgi:hypothetical protein
MSDAAKRALFRHAVEGAIPDIINKLVDPYGSHWSADTEDDGGDPDGDWWGGGCTLERLRMQLLPMMNKVARTIVERARKDMKSAKATADDHCKLWGESYHKAYAIRDAHYLEDDEKIRRLCSLLHEHVKYSSGADTTDAELDTLMAPAIEEAKIELAEEEARKIDGELEKEARKAANVLQAKRVEEKHAEAGGESGLQVISTANAEECEGCNGSRDACDCSKERVE